MAESAPAAPRPTVCPSGSALATAVRPMLPPAPGRFSITSGWPSFSLTRGAMARTMASALPPGGKVTITRMGLVGQAASWARAGLAKANSVAPPRAAHSARRRKGNFIDLSPGSGGGYPTAIQPAPYSCVKRNLSNDLSFQLMNNDSRFIPSMRQLRAFAAVYHLRKVSAAAEQLSVTQSAVSLSLRQLEDGLGARLFDRTTRTLQPTQAAHEAIVLAERILRDAEALGAGTLELSQLRRGRVSVAVTPTLAELLLPAAVVRFRERHPGIHVDINDCAPDQFVARVVG